jgi:hypothetical protein
MDELVFTDSTQWPKVTCLFTRARNARGWQVFMAKEPPSLAAANVIASQRTTVGTDVSMSGGRFRRKRRRRLGEEEQTTQEVI